MAIPARRQRAGLLRQRRRRQEQHQRLRHQGEPAAGGDLHQRLKTSRQPGPVAGLQHRRRPDLHQVPGNPCWTSAPREFRDPKVFWYAPANEWRMVVVKATEHKVSIYSSPNLKNWTHLSDFGPAGAVGGVWECPDLFPLAVDGNPRNVKWVMVVNLNPGGIAGGSGGQYFVGDFDGTTFTSDDPATYTPPTGTVLQDFESTSFAPWTTTGTAFGDGPTAGNAPGQGGVSGYLGDQLANSFHGGDASTGTLTSPDFTITKDYLNFLVGGGNHPHVPGTVLNGTPPTGTGVRRLRGQPPGAPAGPPPATSPTPAPSPAPSATSSRSAATSAASWSTPSSTTTRPPARSPHRPSPSTATTSTCWSAAATTRTPPPAPTPPRSTCSSTARWSPPPPGRTTRP